MSASSATRTIVNSLPQGWTAAQTVSPVTNYRVDNSSGQLQLVCEYGAAGAIQRPPGRENCTKLPDRDFSASHFLLPPPQRLFSEGPVLLTDNGTAELDAGGQPDLRLRADNPFLR